MGGWWSQVAKQMSATSSRALENAEAAEDWSGQSPDQTRSRAPEQQSDIVVLRQASSAADTKRPSTGEVEHQRVPRGAKPRGDKPIGEANARGPSREAPI